MIQYIIPAALAFFVGLSLWAIKRERLTLEYDIVESDLFPREGGVGKYFVCALRNTGNRAIQGISIEMVVSKGTIDSVEYSNSQLFDISEQTTTAIKGAVPLLNPKERISAIITIRDAGAESSLKVEARAIGVTAGRKSSEFIPEYFKMILPAVAAGVALLAVSSIWNTYTQSRVTKSIERIGNFKELSKGLDESTKKLDELKSKSDKIARDFEDAERKREQGEPEREQVVFGVLNRAGLSHILPSLMTISGEGLPFWKTGLHLMNSYLLDQKNAQKYVQALVQLSKVDFIAPSSRGFLLYLAGKIEKAEGNTDAAIKYFEMCKKETPLMHEYLMAQDPAYDLKAIKSWLSKNRPK